ncbi:MAG: uroporphyrinogen-III C-methyltransferase [Pirellulaceae bacterium]|nr:uroporphyrinogen-III C-methyltransferase [Planctomycetales bacterium]
MKQLSPSPPHDPATVYLVGGGPGHPGLITLRGAECLRQADVVLYDYLVNPLIVEHAPRSAERICLGRHGRSRIWSQDEINHAMVEFARAGKTVVRLKGGDPSVFGRLAEETSHLAQHGVPYEVVPGVTVGLAVASHVGISLTHRETASAVALVTAHEDSTKPAQAIDYHALAQFPGTLVFYMAVTTAAAWTQALIDAGMDPNTPVALVRRCTWSNQQTIRTVLGDVAAQLTPRSRFPPPVVAVVGPLAQQPVPLDWFAQAPLRGNTVLVTRPREQSAELRDLLLMAGADVLLQPTISIAPPEDWKLVDQAFRAQVTSGEMRPDWLVFSSANGVSSFFDRLLYLDLDIRLLGAPKIAVVGEATAKQLARYHLIADLVPGHYNAESLADELAPLAANKRVWIIRADRTREILRDQLASVSAIVHELIVYRSLDVTTPDPDILHAMQQGQIDWVTVTSSAIAQSLVQMFGEVLGNTRLASLSPRITDTLKQLGHAVAAEAPQPTNAALVDAIIHEK